MPAATGPPEVFMRNARYFVPNFDQNFQFLNRFTNNNQDQISRKSVKWEKRLYTRKDGWTDRERDRKRHRRKDGRKDRWT